MTKNRIHIENLRIRLPKSASNAQDLAAGIGHEVLKNIAGAAQRGRGPFRIDKISAGKINAAGRSEDETGKLVASRVAGEIRKKIGQEE